MNEREKDDKREDSKHTFDGREIIYIFDLNSLFYFYFYIPIILWTFVLIFFLIPTDCFFVNIS